MRESRVCSCAALLARGGAGKNSQKHEEKQALAPKLGPRTQVVGKRPQERVETVICADGSSPLSVI